MSHPVWVRGLKLLADVRQVSLGESHPVWVRGLKQDAGTETISKNQSHPVWVRGLKLCALVGALGLLVAPRVGAWIETVYDPLR